MSQHASSDKPSRSIYIGNIPYEATEEQLKEIFSQAGPIVTLRLVYDRETGKPKGYGFCEYQDSETAHSATRNLNNVEYHGRPLRIGFAAGEASHVDQLAGVVQPAGDPQHGPEVPTEKAPEAISRAVASLPPEQMFELMRQMKQCIQNNPNEARQMLLQNPQLAYALLQAQIVMKIVEPQMALMLLQTGNDSTPAIVKGTPGTSGAVHAPPQAMMAGAPSAPMARPAQPPPQWHGAPAPVPMQSGPPVSQPQFDLRTQQRPPPPPQDPRAAVRPADPRRGGQAAVPPAPQSLPFNLEGIPTAGTDQEKAQLIMQVLRLSDEQIATLPADQRQSIMALKEQINNQMT